MVLVCGIDGCDSVFKSAKSLKQHQKTKHSGFTYYCGGCGAGPVSQNSGIVSHRRGTGCVGSKCLELRPGLGFHYNGTLYDGLLPPLLQRVGLEARGEPLGELGDVNPTELRRLGEAQVELEADARRTVQVPQGPATRNRLRLPTGMYCTMCPQADDGQSYTVSFENQYDWANHIMDVHCGMGPPPVVEPEGMDVELSDDDESDDEESDGEASGGNMPIIDEE